MTLRSVLLQVAEAFEGVVAGHSGPRQVPATLVRNTAHWINLLAWAHQQTGQTRFADTVAQLADYLCSSEARPYGYAYDNLVTEAELRGNGLIGQAWVMEGLIRASETLETSKYREIALELFHQHQFDEQLCLWHILHLEGAVGVLSPVVNQQVWFSAMGALLRDDGAIQKAQRFLNNLEHHVHLLPEGLWGMRLRSESDNQQSRHFSVRDTLRRLRQRFYLRSDEWREFSYEVNSVGYHSFAFYGLAILKTQLPKHPFWQSEVVQAGLKWLRSNQYKRKLRRNPFAMGYNPAGLEVPYILSVFEVAGWQEGSHWWLSEQIRRHYNPATCRFDRNTTDPAELTARAYEATRIPECLMELPVLFDTP